VRPHDGDVWGTDTLEVRDRHLLKSVCPHENQYLTRPPDTSKLNQIDTYTYPEYDRANILPVGMAQYDTVASPEGQYAYDPT
jgi:hypothetical protein